MKAIILAAGRGTRMKKLGDHLPKCLIELKGQPLLEYQLNSLRQAGIGEIALVTGYQHHLFADYDLVKFHNERWTETNMVTSLGCAREWLQSEPCVVSYSDIFYKASAVISLMKNKDELAVTYDQNWLELWTRRFGNPLLDAETFRMNSNRKLSEIGKKPKSANEIEGQYMGLLKFSPSSWAEIERLLARLSLAERDNIHMTGMLQLVLEEGRTSITALPYVDRWGEVDTMDDVMLYEKMLNPN